MNDSHNLNALPEGSMIQEFKVVRVLGAGSFGIVYLAENVYFPEHVAIKEFLPSQLAQRVDGSTVVPNSSQSQEAYQWALEKFVKEARILWELGRPERHPNIAYVSRFHEANGTAYMVMDFEEGEPLSDTLKRENTVAEDQLKAILYPLLDGLEKVHAKSVWHRDIKPANILIRPDGSPVLIDFGAARWEAGSQDRSIMEVFTPDFAAPEQVLSHGKLGPWTDIYGLGATLYRAIHAKPPTSPSQRALGAEHVPAGEAVARGYSAGFLAAIDAALALKQEERPQSVADWRRLLGAAPDSGASDDTGGTVMMPGSAARPIATRAPSPRHTPSKKRPSATADAGHNRARAPTNSSTARAAGQRLTGTAGIAAIFIGFLIVAVAVYQWYGSSPDSPLTGTDTLSGEGQDSAKGLEIADSPTGDERPQAGENAEDSSLAEVPSVQPGPDVTLLPTAAPTPIMDQARAIIDTLECASLSVNFDPSGFQKLQLSGFVEDLEMLEQISERLNTIDGVRGVNASVQIHAKPFCAILTLLEREANLGSGVMRPPKIRLDRTDYVDGELLQFEVTQTDAFGGYLYIDYIDSDGMLVHLLPTKQRASNAVPANDQVIIGKQQRYEIAPPHGKGMVLVIATRQQIFRQTRPQVETATDYLRALQQGLRSLSQAGALGDVVSNYAFISTRPKS